LVCHPPPAPGVPRRPMVQPQSEAAE